MYTSKNHLLSISIDVKEDAIKMSKVLNHSFAFLLQPLDVTFYFIFNKCHFSKIQQK